MSKYFSYTFFSKSEQDTIKLARAFGREVLSPRIEQILDGWPHSDIIALRGPSRMGKTLFARASIKAVKSRIKPEKLGKEDGYFFERYNFSLGSNGSQAQIDHLDAAFSPEEKNLHRYPHQEMPTEQRPLRSANGLILIEHPFPNDLGRPFAEVAFGPTDEQRAYNSVQDELRDKQAYIEGLIRKIANEAGEKVAQSIKYRNKSNGQLPRIDFDKLDAFRKAQSDLEAEINSIGEMKPPEEHRLIRVSIGEREETHEYRIDDFCKTDIAKKLRVDNSPFWQCNLGN